MSYMLLSLAMLIPTVVVTAVCAVVSYRDGQLRAWAIPTAITCGILLVLTAVFDNAIIQSGLVAYDENTIWGVKIGAAPIEDFAYTLTAGLMGPSLWWFLTRSQESA